MQSTILLLLNKDKPMEEEIKNHKHFNEIVAYLCGICHDHNADKFTSTLENVRTPNGIIGNYKITIEKL